MKNNILKVSICLFFCAILLAPATTYATTDMSKNTLQTSDHNAPIWMEVVTHHINKVDSWVMPYIVTTKGHVGYWEITGKTYYKWKGMTRSAAYGDRGHILPMFTHYYGHVAEIKYISGWDYTGKIWTKPNDSDGPYIMYELHSTYDEQHGSQTTIKKL